MKVWLTTNDDKELLSHYDFKRACCLAYIDPEGKYHDMTKYGKVKDFSRKRSATVAFKPEDCVEYCRQSTKCIRVTERTLDPDSGILNIRLIKELGHLPTPDPRSESEKKCCARCRWASERQLRARVLHCSICNVWMCVPCYHHFHMERNVTKLKNYAQKSKDMN